MKLRKSFIVILSVIIALLVVLIIFAVKGIGPFNTAPSIELKGDKEMTLYLGDEFKDPGYTAMDCHGNNITDKVQVDKSDISGGGTHEITYSVTDNDQTATATRTVEVKYKTPSKDDPHYGHGIPVCMYHYVYDPQDPPKEISSNWISTTDLESHLKYLTDNDYYFPTWKEMRDYVDGKIELPVKSVVLSFDDCSKTFQENGIPLLEKYNVKATSFVICSSNGEEVMKKYGSTCKHVTFQSHSYDLHKGGGNIGHGGIFTALSYEDGLADLKKSTEILKTNEAFAYPFGDYNDTCKKAVKDAGFLCAFTTEYGQCHPGDDPTILPRVRISEGMGANAFAASIKSDK